MDWTSLIALLLGGGGVTYLIIEKLFSLRHSRVEVQGKVVENSSQVADLYKQIDDIVMKKTLPLEEKLDKALMELLEIKSHWCCYKENCNDRILFPRDDSHN